MGKLGGMSIHTLTETLSKDWNLQLTRYRNEWTAFYSNVSELPRIGKGKTPQEAINNATKLVKEGK